nr:hypothetical protein [Tanacetum cinerariifolium]
MGGARGRAYAIDGKIWHSVVVMAYGGSMGGVVFGRGNGGGGCGVAASGLRCGGWRWRSPDVLPESGGGAGKNGRKDESVCV